MIYTLLDKILLKTLLLLNFIINITVMSKFVRENPQKFQP